MSTCKQAMAARRKGKHDPRYKKLRNKDAATQEAKLKKKIENEKIRAQRKGGK